MEALDGVDLATRLSMEAKDFWVHLDADGSLEKYPARQHARRVQEKLGIDEGLIYLAGQPAKNNEDSDMPAPFRQRRYFYYLTGCNEPSCHVTYDIQHDILSLFIPRIDPKRVIWNGRGSTLAEAVERYDIDEVYYVDELGDAIKDWSDYYGGHGSDIYVLHNGQLPRIPELHAIIDSESLQPAMNAARMIKDDHEIQLIRKANDVSSKAHKKILSKILEFKNEAQVEGLFVDICIAHQAKQQAYDPIAASGANAGTLHYDANNENFDDRQLMCLDAGCEYELYASDITRTFPLAESWPSKEAENIYKLVERMQESCISRLAPGVRYLDLHILAHQIAIDGLLKLGILHNGTKEEIYKAGTSRAFFPHGLGHHIGLEVHDVGQAELMSVREGKVVIEQTPSLFPENFHLPVYDAATCHAPTDAQSSQLEEGMVVTVEPGIYFSVYALEHFYLPSPIHSRFINQRALQHYMPIGGVRIEDDILITSKGYENLTTAPKGEAMFDIIRGHVLNPKAAKRPIAATPAGLSVPSLFRAPGVPPQTTPQILRPLNRAATMPYEAPPRDTSEPDRRNHSLGFRRSMTTDERVQHWRQSCQRPSPPRCSPPKPEMPITMCGSSASDLRHTFVGDGCNFPFQAQGLLQCTKCVILTQTLGRLRYNLALSEQSSPTRSQHSQTREGPIYNPPLPQTASPAFQARHEAEKAATHPPKMCSNTRRPDNQMCSYSKSDIPFSLESQTSPPRNGKSSSSGKHISCKEISGCSPIPGPEQYYRDFSPIQHLTEPSRMDILDQPEPAQAPDSNTLTSTMLDALKLPVAMPIRARRSQRQEPRRPSNHTDDRDWMA